MLFLFVLSITGVFATFGMTLSKNKNNLKITIEKNIEQNLFSYFSLVLKLFLPKEMALEMHKKFIYWICMEVLTSEENLKIILL